MKAIRIVDTEGPNPDFKPPIRAQFPIGPQGDEAFADAKACYDVPHSILQPAGTLIQGPGAWVHCFPDESGHFFEHDTATGKTIFHRKPGLVRAVPADEPCRRALETHIAHAAKSRGVPVQVIRDEVDRQIAVARQMQADVEKRRAEANASAPIEATAPAEQQTASVQSAAQAS